MSTEKLYKIIWKTTGFIEGVTFRESELPDHNRDEVLGPDREYVEAVPGTPLYKLYVDVTSEVNTDIRLTDVDLNSTTYNWETNELNIVYFPDLVWDDIRAARNTMLAGCDNMFNEDTPDPLKSEWIEHRQLLRDMITREQAANRSPSTVKWNDYIPPFPPSARIGVPDSEKSGCAWYKGKNTYPSAAIIGSPESLAAYEEFQRMNNSTP